MTKVPSLAMADAASIRPDVAATRPVYEGMAWRCVSQSEDRHWSARSQTTPITYGVSLVEEGRWASRQGFRDAPGKPHMEIGIFPDMRIAMTACERHDFRFWASAAGRSGVDCVFLGSPDHVADFVSNLAQHERDDLLDMISGGCALPDGSNFGDTASFFPAVKSGLKQERNGSYSMTIGVEAADVPLWMMQCAPGTRIVLGAVDVARGSDEEWIERSTSALRRTFALAQDNSFHIWVAQKYDRWGLVNSAMTQTSEEVEKAVAETLRRLIGCPSRRDLTTNRDAVLRLEKIDREFYFDLSRGFGSIAVG